MRCSYLSRDELTLILSFIFLLSAAIVVGVAWGQNTTTVTPELEGECPLVVYVS